MLDEESLSLDARQFRPRRVLGGVGQAIVGNLTGSVSKRLPAGGLGLGSGPRPRPGSAGTRRPTALAPPRAAMALPGVAGCKAAQWSTRTRPTAPGGAEGVLRPDHAGTRGAGSGKIKLIDDNGHRRRIGSPKRRARTERPLVAVATVHAKRPQVKKTRPYKGSNASAVLTTRQPLSVLPGWRPARSAARCLPTPGADTGGRPPGWPCPPGTGPKKPDLAVVDLTQPAIPLPGHPGRVLTLLGKATFINQQHRLRAAQQHVGWVHQLDT